MKKRFGVCECINVYVSCVVWDGGGWQGHVKKDVRRADGEHISQDPLSVGTASHKRQLGSKYATFLNLYCRQSCYEHKNSPSAEQEFFFLNINISTHKWCIFWSTDQSFPGEEIRFGYRACRQGEQIVCANIDDDDRLCGEWLARIMLFTCCEHAIRWTCRRHEWMNVS